MSRTSFVGVVSSILFVVACSSSTPPNAAPTDAPATDAATTEPDTSTATAPLTYPEGPYGLGRGNVFPNLKFKGYHDGTGAWTDIQMSDYYDPDGSRGINAIYITVSAEWCPVCKEDAHVLPLWYSSHYKPRGARFITSILQSVDRTAPTKAAVDAWVKAYAPNFDIVSDETEATFPKTFMALPVNFEIDPRTMTVFRSFNNGFQFTRGVPGLDLLLDQNHAPSAPAIVEVTDDAGAAGTDADTTDAAIDG